jgi:hypothetical protein
MLQLSRKCWSSAFNAPGSRLSSCKVRVSKNVCSSSGGAQAKERQDENQFTTKIDGFLSSMPPWMLMYFFEGFFKISPCVWPNSGFWCCVFVTLWITLMWWNFPFQTNKFLFLKNLENFFNENLQIKQHSLLCLSRSKFCEKLPERKRKQC